MDAATLKSRVETLINDKINQQLAFTTVDISHPIIADDPSVRHRDIRQVLNEMVNRGDFDNAMYTSSPITVYPSPNKPQTARLFHPDEPTFDPSSYHSTDQELTRKISGWASAPPDTGRTPQYDTTDSDGDDGSDDGVNVVTTTAKGHQVVKQCFVQSKRDTLSIPRILVRSAGLSIGDQISVTHTNGVIKIEKTITGSQEVDKEGRIRLNALAKRITKASGAICNAMVVDDMAGKKYIQVN